MLREQPACGTTGRQNAGSATQANFSLSRLLEKQFYYFPVVSGRFNVYIPHILVYISCLVPARPCVNILWILSQTVSGSMLFLVPELLLKEFVRLLRPGLKRVSVMNWHVTFHRLGIIKKMSCLHNFITRQKTQIVYLLCSITPAFKIRFYLRPPISDQLFLLSINLLTTFLCALYVGKLVFSVRKNTGLFFGVGIFTSRTPSPMSLACKGGIMQMFFHLCQECRAVPKMNSDRCDGLTDWRKRARLSDTFLHIFLLLKVQIVLKVHRFVCKL